MLAARSLSHGILLFITITLLAACGGGGSGGGDSTVSAASEGTISGFGSVIMNGVRWRTEDARIEIDGRAARQDELDVGMFVRIEGSRARDGRNARADRVFFDSKLRGPVREIEELGPDSRALVIFGIRAIVSRGGTRFRDTSFDALRTGRVVEASGLVDRNGDLEVTHLRDRGIPVVGETEVKLFGTVSGLAGGSFVLRETEVFFDDETEIDDFGPMGLRDGLDVRVEGVLLANDDVDADEIEGPRRGRDDDEFDEIEIEGIVSNYVSIGEFDVAGRPVDASRARLIPNDPSLLMDGVRVEVEGQLDDRRVLIANKLKFRSNRFRIEAEVASDDDVDPDAGTLFLLDILIELDPNARMRDRLDDRSGFGLEDVRAGDFLEVRGLAKPDGRVIGTRLERERHDAIRLKGPVDMIDADARMFTILGVPIETTDRTEFEIEDDDGDQPVRESEFYRALSPGRIVQVKDREDGDETRIDFADEAELEELELEDDGDEDERDDDDDDDDVEDDDEMDEDDEDEAEDAR